MALIAERACVVGAIGVIVSTTLHQAARGAKPRAEKEARFPRSAIGLIDRPTLLFQWRSLFLPQRAESVGDGYTEGKC